MKKNRIFFHENPWPEGHPIAKFVWSTKCVEDMVWFHFHLETADYDAERKIDDSDYPEDMEGWFYPSLWQNYVSVLPPPC